jgi:endo-1,4-beta-xylanase
VATGVAAALGLAMITPASAATGPLKTLAEAQGRYFGTALVQSNLTNTALTNVSNAQFDMVTPGNEMKWDTTEPSNGVFNFGPGDAIVNFAVAHGDRIRGHNLVWHSQLPSWVSSLPSTQVKAAMETHITTEVNHYQGKLYAWDVVNEPFNEDGSFRSDAFTTAFGGSGYIADALRTARAADPTAKLYLNDFNIEGMGTKSNAMFTLVQSLISQGVPIDGVGFESHFILGQVPSTMQANMARFAALGLDVPATAANLTQQANDYAAVVNDCLAVARCVGVTQWGVGDADSWIPGAFAGQGAATMWDNNYQPKPAFTAVQTALGGTGTTPPPGNTVTVTNPGAQSSTVGTAASVQLRATDSATGQTLSYSATGLPAGLAVNATSGLISGTPTTAGTSNVTVTVRDGTGASGTAAFAWTVAAVGGGGGTGTCHVDYVKQTEWAGGIVANLTVTNTGTTAINGWTVRFTFPGDTHFTTAWNATVTQTGAAMSATNLSYNATIAPGGNTSWGFQGTWTGNDAAPTAFSVNGSACS